MILSAYTSVGNLHLFGFFPQAAFPISVPPSMAADDYNPVSVSSFFFSFFFFAFDIYSLFIYNEIEALLSFLMVGLLLLLLFFYDGRVKYS